MTDRILTRPGSQIAYSTTGTGPVAISAHGLSSSRANDDSMGVSFASLPDRTVVRYDARGHGASTGRGIPADYAWSALAGDLLALADEVSPDAAIDAIGASMGCATILHAVVTAPERFRRLVLVIPPTAWETRAAMAAGYETQAKLVEEEGLAALLEMSEGLPNPPAMRPDVRFAPAVSEELLPTVFRGAALSQFPDREQVAQIRQPVLILAWIGDPGHPLSTSEELLALLPDAELSVAQTPEDVEGWVAAADEFLSRP
ncbi:MAG TPA: alpha/beta hydrolase [Pseudolysinimonas sp.]|jgi:pimeloyl-ACP methyl ester carboxylesterase